MKAKDLANELLKHPDFEVQCVYVDEDIAMVDHRWALYRTLKVTDVADIGYSSQVIVLATEEI